MDQVTLAVSDSARSAALHDAALVLDPRSPARGQRQKGVRRQPALGTSLQPDAWGRWRGGLTPKIHAVADANGNPIALKLSGGQAYDGRGAADLLDSVRGGQILLADRGDDSDALREA